MKQCSVCKEWKTFDNFCKHKKAKDGYNWSCKQCKAKNDKIYQENNKEKISIQHKKYREENLESILEKNRQDYWDNREKQLNTVKKYAENNKEKIAEYQKKYREDNIERLLIYEKEFHQEKRNTLRAKILEQCYNPKSLDTIPALAYIIKIVCLTTNEEYLKPGVTSYSTDFRYRGYGNFDIQVLTEMFFSSEVEAYAFEQILLQSTKEHYKRMSEYKNFPGYTECRTLDALDILSKYF